MPTPKLTLTPEEAAAYLNISVEKLAEYVKIGSIRTYWHKKQKYHLAGEIDMLKSMISNTQSAQTRLKEKIAENKKDKISKCHDNYCSQFRD